MSGRAGEPEGRGSMAGSVIDARSERLSRPTSHGMPTSRELVRSALAHRVTTRAPYCIRVTKEFREAAEPQLGQPVYDYLDNDVACFSPPWWRWDGLAADWSAWDVPASMARVRGYGDYEPFADTIKRSKEKADKIVLVTVGGKGSFKLVTNTSILTVKHAATLAPGSNVSDSNAASAPGILTVDGLAQFSGQTVMFESGSTFAVQLHGTTAGTLHDQLSVIGTVGLGGTLAIELGYAAKKGQTFTIIANDSTDAVVGSFSNAGSLTATHGGQEYGFSVSRAGGTVNDVVLTVVSAPSSGPLITIL
jgi:hypothetical protein